MDDTVRIVIIAAIIILALFVLYASSKSRKFEASHQGGVYKTKSIIRGLEAVFLLMFAGAALLTFKNIIGQVPGVILMAVAFIGWLPFQVLMYSMVSVDEEAITYMSPLRKTEIQWQDVKSVSLSKSSIFIKSGGRSIRVRSFFAGFDKIKETVKEKCPDKEK